jgi:aldehyde:ferredoxin oxidoreductase
MEKSFGWTGRIARVDLRTRTVDYIATMDYAPRFIGGRGLASRLYWETVSPATKAFDPDAALFFMTGPLAGTKAQAGSRWLVLGKSPLAFPEQYAFGNLGGRWGAALKWAGLDGLMIVGAADHPVILEVTDGGRIGLTDAAGLWGRDVPETLQALNVRFGSGAEAAVIGAAGEKRVRFASVMAGDGAVGGKGFGAVMGAKNLKAVVIQCGRAVLSPAKPDDFRAVTRDITALWRGETSERYWMDAMLDGVEKVKTTPCFACPGLCGRGLYADSRGQSGYGKNCASAYCYAYAEKDFSGSFGAAAFTATCLANRHGLCCNEINMLVDWVPRAIQRGLIDGPAAGLDPAAYGSREWITNLIEAVVQRRGIGDLLAEGSRRATEALGAEDLLDNLATAAGFHVNLYSPRLFLSAAPIYATEPVHPITQLHGISFPMVKWMIWHGTDGMMSTFSTERLQQLARIFWGAETAAQFDTPEGMGRAAKIIQDRAYAKENLIGCDFFWPIDYSGNSETGVGDPTLEARLFSAVTGREMDEQDYLLSGARSQNLCRAIYLREGRQGRVDDRIEEINFTLPLDKPDSVMGVFNPEAMLPGRNGIFSALGTTVSRTDFKTVMDDYYQERGWVPASGLQTREGLADLELEDMTAELAERGLLAE